VGDVETFCLVGAIFGDSEETQPAKYANGLFLNVDTRCFLTDDHRYEAMCVEIFPFLKSVTKEREDY
jgi:hypothetical protein